MLTLALAALLAPVPAAGAAAADATPLASSITEVVVYGSAARVRRSAQLPGTGQFVLPGLPGGLDADSVRVRLSSGSVASVEVQDRLQASAPDARRQVLRERVAGLLAEQRTLGDRRDVLLAVREHLMRMLRQEEQAHAGEVASGRPSVEAWQASLTFVTESLTRATDEIREVDLQLERLATQLQDAQAELGLAESDLGLHLRDVIVDVIADAAATLDLEYLVGGAGWTPLYELRTSADARRVELAYRAKVWQQTGEDWRDTTLLLSTAQPQRGARGPEPWPIKVRLLPPSDAEDSTAKLVGRGRRNEELEQLGYVGGEARFDAAPAAPPYAAEVEDQGLSVQFRLPRSETIESRDRASTVLVGQQSLEVSPEHYCTPALDTTVWLRGWTRNTTPWTLLPGAAAVFFGNDYIGQTAFDDPVLPEQEFTLHLGADPGLLVQRTQTADLHEEPGFLSRRQSQTEAWRIRIENNAAHAAAPDGSVEVIVREALPVSTDERIEVEILQETVAPATGERWQRELDEQGLHTWIVRVPRGGKLDLAWRARVSWPEDLEVFRTSGR